MAHIKTVCVFCGSRMGKAKKSAESAHILGRGLAEAGFGIIYGGGQIGLMGIMAKAALDANGHVTGVIPTFLNKREIRYDAVSELIQTQTLRDRIKIMADKSDAFIALPGGVGTLDELMQMLTMNILREHDKPIVLVDEDGFWQPFMRVLEDMASKEFLYPNTIEKLTLVPDAQAAIENLRARNG